MLTEKSFVQEGMRVVEVPTDGEYVVLRVDLGQSQINDDGSISVQPALLDSEGNRWVIRRRFAPGGDEAGSHRKREATGPVGPEWGYGKPICHGPNGAGGLPVCGHKWSDHDDDGCLWEDCDCTLPGERK